MNSKVERVELFEQGILKMVLTKSDEGSLNGRRDAQTGQVYSGRATSARILGPKGSGVTFYDDQQFRIGQNSVYVEKLTADPIEVFIGQNFVRSGEEQPDGIFFGEEPGKFKWVLFKAVKRSWLDQIKDAIPSGFDAVLKAACSRYPQVAVARNVAAIIFEPGGPKSDNYRVDNVSSVQFGTDDVRSR